jgi:predicted signal transduction protein with EAL and GGDEF domain
MSADSLIQALPDLVAFVRRNGVITRHVGGRGLPGIAASGSLEGRRLDDVWGEEAAELLGRMVRRALATREPVEGRFVDGTRQYAAHVDPKSPDRVLCVIRALGAADRRSSDSGFDACIERRDFVTRFQQSVTDAALRERPLALCMILLQGLGDIGHIIDFSISETVLTTALLRLREVKARGAVSAPWYVGQLGESLLAVVVEGSVNRGELLELTQALCDSLAQPISVGSATFELSPRAGVARLGRDAQNPQALLEHARSALHEARRSSATDVKFFSETLAMRPLNRLDYERELRDAIEADQLCLRYAARHDLASGRLVAIQAYLRWRHPLRGDVPPAEFLPVAGSTGLSSSVSRWALGRLRRDLPGLRSRAGHGVRISFGALRHHFASDGLAEDIEAFLRSGELTADLLELRVSEETIAGLDAPERTLGRLADLGASLVVDEFGRGYTSITCLAKLPLRAMQVDRSFVAAVGEDPTALRICRAAVGFARVLGLTPIAPGVDGKGQLRCMREAGFVEGFGDHFGDVASPAAGGAQARNRA